MGVDAASGDIYLGCVNQNATQVQIIVALHVIVPHLELRAQASALVVRHAKIVARADATVGMGMGMDILLRDMRPLCAIR